MRNASLGIAPVQHMLRTGAFVLTLLAPAQAIRGDNLMPPTTDTPLTIETAKQAFREARGISDKDAGKLWGKTLYGPILLADTTTRKVIANEPDPQGTLKAADGVYTGALDKGDIISNAPVEWHGKRWTMLMWPEYKEEFFRHATLAHEMFHRIQPQFGLVLGDVLCPHLDTAEARIWLQLEWRALAKALVSTGTTQDQAIADALLFRATRLAHAAAQADAERRQELTEGVPEYTGLTIGAPDRASAIWRIVSRLTAPAEGSFVRTAAYTTGPAYGFLLDEKMPGWNRILTPKSDLAAMLASKVKPATKPASVQAAFYGIGFLRTSEEAIAAEMQKRKQAFRKKLVDGPTLALPQAGDFQIGFAPVQLTSLDDLGTIYPNLRVTAAWGILIASDDALITPDFSRVFVTAPQKNTPEITAHSQHITGAGWSLELTDGWQMVETTPDRWQVQKIQN